jgi:glucose/arabinose dehydrogenase
MPGCEPESRRTVETGPAENLVLPTPCAPAVQKRSKVIGWPEGRTPTAPPGFEVSLFADKLDNPRWVYVLPNSDVLVMESLHETPRSIRKRPLERSANRITLFRDTNRDGQPDLREVFLTGLNMPFGVLLLGERLYVANTDGLVRYPYHTGQTRITATGEAILDLPGGGGHSTRNVVADAAGRKLYVAVGSRTNVDEQGTDAKDPRRAAILEVDPEGRGMRVFASGFRNPVGMDWEPETNTL